MRLTGIIAGVVAIVAVVALLGLELAATSMATRSARDAIERCADVEDVEVTSIARPAVVGFLRGEVRDVRLTATGVQAGDLRIDRVDARLPVAPAGFGSGPETLTVVADARILEGDLERYLVARAPELASPTLRVTRDELQIGDQRVPFTFGAVVRIDGAGDLQLVPTLGDPRLWSSLGLELEIEVPRELELLSIDLQDGAVLVTARAEIHQDAESQATCPDVALLGIGGHLGCSGAEILAAERSGWR